MVELELAYELPERGAAFFWVGGRGQGLLGLWSLGSAPLGMSLHIAFRVPLDDASDAERGIVSWSQWTAAEF